MSSYITRPTPGDTAWFTHDRFGMFIHFGLYALPARHEWIKTREEIADEDYQRYFDHFNPDLLDAKEWAKEAKAAGMKYVVLTTKHHEGFCLFDSQYTDYKVTNTPYGKDIVREVVDAFRAEGIRIGFYYSLIDWHHPDFPVDILHPDRNRPEKIADNKNRDMKRYAKYMRDQVTELLTNYGDIDILWFDFSYTSEHNKKKFNYLPGLVGKGKDDWEAEELIATARKLRPGIIIDNRTQIEQDIITPEQIKVNRWMTHPKTGEKLVWETCQTFSGSWGYHRDETSWKSPEVLLDLLIGSVAYGGNLLMNVGPTARGCFDARAKDALAVYADWMKYNSRSIYGCTMAEPGFIAPSGDYYTQSEDGKRLYLHLFRYPYKSLILEGLAGKVEYIQFLHDGSEIQYLETPPYYLNRPEAPHAADFGDKAIFLTIPEHRPDITVPVIEIFLK
ncbi:MAG: alpha-L-fucosidase [Clostridia bacterium]|nr:alpha-L-fucosidase [Clostridia bacterium]